MIMDHKNRYHPYYKTNTNNNNNNQQQLQQNIVYNPIYYYNNNHQNYHNHHYYNHLQNHQEQQQLPEFRCPMAGERDADEYFRSLPAGYRFCPLDEELIVHYLKPKIDRVRLPIHRIPDVQLYQHTPEQLTGCYELLREKAWYFFTPRTRKYKNGNRPDRSVGGDLGFWKPTGQDIVICYKGQPVGYKKCLDFCIGKHPDGERSEWKMHEYRIINQTGAPSTSTSTSNTDDMELDRVLCKIYKSSRKNNQDGTVGSATGDQENTRGSTSRDLDQDTTEGSDQEE